MVRLKKIPYKISQPKEISYFAKEIATVNTTVSIEEKSKAKNSTVANNSSMSSGPDVWMLTETGEVHVKDNEGVITLNGEELSFVSWGKVTKSNDSSIVSVLEHYANKPYPQNENYYDYSYKKHKYEKRMAYKKIKVMDQVRKEMEEFEKQEMLIKVQNQPVFQVQKNLLDEEEGEIGSAEESQEMKCEKKTLWDTASSDSDSNSTSRKRRSQQRARRNLKQCYDDQNLAKFFFYRHKLLMTLPLGQKKEFLDILQKVCSS